jgi:hypothetical protein
MEQEIFDYFDDLNELAPETCPYCLQKECICTDDDVRAYGYNGDAL